MKGLRVHDAVFCDVDAEKDKYAPQFILKNVSGVTLRDVNGVKDVELKMAERNEL